MDIHNFDRQYETAQIKLEHSTLSDRNKELIQKFINDLSFENLGNARLAKYTYKMRLIALEIGKDLDVATIDDLKQWVSKVQQKSSLSPWTKKDYKSIIRRFYKWQTKTQGRNKFPPIVDWISTTIKRCEKKLVSPSELHQENDVEKLLNCANNSRDRAMISMVWESGARIGEIGNLNKNEIAFDKYGIIFTVQGKTGARKIRLIASTPYVAAWLSDHPLRHEHTAPLWVAFHGKHKHQRLQYRAIRKMFDELVKHAGVKKRSNPHIFRHSRATFMASHLTEFQMNQYFGWIQGSDMPATYVHMNGKEVEGAILRLNGVVTEQNQKPQELMPRVCVRCDTINAHDTQFCRKCGGGVDLKVALLADAQHERDLDMRTKADKMMNLLLQDKEMRDLLMSKLSTLGGVL